MSGVTGSPTEENRKAAGQRFQVMT